MALVRQVAMLLALPNIEHDSAEKQILTNLLGGLYAAAKGLSLTHTLSLFRARALSLSLSLSLSVSLVLSLSLALCLALSLDRTLARSVSLSPSLSFSFSLSRIYICIDSITASHTKYECRGLDEKARVAAVARCVETGNDAVESYCRIAHVPAQPGTIERVRKMEAHRMFC